MLTVELPLRISRRTRNAATVLFMYTPSMSLISSISGIPASSVAEGTEASSSPAVSPAVGRRRRPSSILSHSLMSWSSTSVVKNGCCRTLRMNGRRISAPVLLSYFFRIFTSPSKSIPTKNIKLKELAIGSSKDLGGDVSYRCS